MWQTLHERKDNPSQKRAGRVAQGVDPEFKPQYHHHQKKKKNLLNNSPHPMHQALFSTLGRGMETQSRSLRKNNQLWPNPTTRPNLIWILVWKKLKLCAVQLLHTDIIFDHIDLMLLRNYFSVFGCDACWIVYGWKQQNQGFALKSG
jgi:hypothetical protein